MSSNEQLATLEEQLRGEAESPVTLDPDVFQGLFADKLLDHLADYQSKAEAMATAAAELVKIKAEQDAADADLAAAPSEDDVNEAYGKYLDSFDDEDADPAETRRLLQAWKDVKRERDDAVEEHRKKSEELTRRYKAAMEGIGDETDDGDWDTEGDGDGENKPKRTGRFDDNDTSERKMTEEAFDELMSNPSGTQLSSDTPTTAAPTSTMMPTAAQTSPAAGAAMPTASATPAFSPSPSVNPQRGKERDKDKSREKEVEPLPLPGVVSTSSTPLDRGSSTTGTTTKDISGKSPTLGLTNAAPGANNPGANPRGGGGMVGGMPMGGAPIGAGGKTTTSTGSKILDADRTLTKRQDDDISISGGTVSRDILDIPEKEAAEEEEKIRKFNTQASDKKR